jgi:hypothetical protein
VGFTEGREEVRREMLDKFRAILLNIVSVRFGQPDQSLTNRISAISSIEELHYLIDRAVLAGSLADLRQPLTPALDAPSSPPDGN